MDNMTRGLVSEEIRQRRLQRRAVELREALVASKSVTFIKSGQALALRADLIKIPQYVKVDLVVVVVVIVVVAVVVVAGVVVGAVKP